MSFKKEFKEFVMRGNVLDLAIAVIVGGAFGKIVSSLVADILMPPIGYLVNGVKFTALKLTLPSVMGHEPATINYGNFLQTVFDFLIISFCVFVVIKLVKKLTKSKVPQEEPPKGPSEEVKLLTEIRDFLRNKNSN